VALSFFDAPYVIERPGPVVNVLGEYQDKAVIQITGTKTYPTEGELGLLSVSIVGSPEQTPSWPELFFAWIDPAQAIAPLEEFYPNTKTVEQVDAESTAMMPTTTSSSISVNPPRDVGFVRGMFSVTPEAVREEPQPGESEGPQNEQRH
jgi:PDZ domain-containing protein